MSMKISDPLDILQPSEGTEGMVWDTQDTHELRDTVKDDVNTR